MFKNEYQGGQYFEVFSAQWKDSPSQWKQPSSGIKKVFDKEVKSFVVAVEGSAINTRIELPRDPKQSLGLTQRYLVLQLLVPKGHDFSIELGVADMSPHRRRLLLSTTCHKETHSDPLRAKFPLGFILRSTWLNLCFDLNSLVSETARGQTFRCLESVCVSGSCRVRRVFTMRSQPLDTSQDEDLYGFTGINNGDLEDIPRQCQLAPDISQCTQIVNVTKVKYYEAKIRGTEPDLNSSWGKKNSSQESQIAFGSKVPPPKKGSGKEATTSSRQSKNAQNRAKSEVATDGSVRTTHSASGQERSAAQERVGSGRETADSRGSCRERKNSDPGTNMEDPEVVVDKESLRTSHTWTDGAENKEDIPFVKPHPPRQPSSGSRRKPRVKSAGKERTPHSASYREEVRNHSASSRGHRSGSVSSTDHVTITTQNAPRGAANDDEDVRNPGKVANSLQQSEGAVESEESITDIIATLKVASHDTDSDDEDDEDEVYTFSSPPKSAPRRAQIIAAAKAKRQAKNHRTRVRKKSNDHLQNSTGTSAKSRAAHFESDFYRSGNQSSDEEPSIRTKILKKSSPNRSSKTASQNKTVSTNRSGQEVKPVTQLEAPSIVCPTYDDYRSPNVSQSRMSISRKSLREIPKDELRRSGGQKVYNSNKYQMSDLSDSYEAQMLLELQKEAMEDGVDSEGVEEDGNPPIPRALNRSKLNYGGDSDDSSSDDTSMSTLKSPGSVKYRSHNYQDEMKIFSNGFLTQSNPRDWGNVFSPPIVVQGVQENGLSDRLVPTQDLSPQTPGRMGDAAGSKLFGDENRRELLVDNSDCDDELDLLYDPILNCYFDPSTAKYYELL